MSKEWDKKNMKTLGVNMKKEEAEAFQEYAKKNNTTAGALLRGFVQAALSSNQEDKAPSHISGMNCLVTYKNVDRLKHETAFHNPTGNMNPDDVLNYYLEKVFEILDAARR